MSECGLLGTQNHLFLVGGVALEALQRDILGLRQSEQGRGPETKLGW